MRCATGPHDAQAGSREEETRVPLCLPACLPACAFRMYIHTLRRPHSAAQHSAATPTGKVAAASSSSRVRSARATSTMPCDAAKTWSVWGGAEAEGGR